MKKLRSDRYGVGAAATAIVAVLVIAGAGAGVYYVISDDGGGGFEGFSLDDPELQGNIGIGSTFEYKVQPNSATNEGVTAPTGNILMTVTGQSGSYYYAEVDLKWNFATEVEDEDIEVMFHKQSGAIRFGSDDGNDSVVYNNEVFDLKKSKLIIHDEDIDDIGDVNGMEQDDVVTMIFSSSSADAVPYKMSFSCAEYNISGELQSMNVIDAVQYLKSEVIGDLMRYDVTDTAGTANMRGEALFVVAGERANEAIILTMFRGPSGFVSIDYDEHFGDLKSFVKDDFDQEGMAVQETILTMDGDADCEVFGCDDGKMYVGSSNDIVYRVNGSNEGYQMDLVRYDLHVPA